MTELRKTECTAGTGADMPSRLGRNRGGYAGETIDIQSVLADCAGFARAHGWTLEELAAGAGVTLLTLRRRASTSSAAARVYLSTGIHGDEPAGPLAMRQLLAEDAWPAQLDLWLCPCLNPVGFNSNSRENAAGADLNRQYLEPTAAETQAHIAWLERQPSFDVCFCLHEDWEAQGFYVYELNPEGRPSLAETMVASVAELCPIDRSELIEGRPARDGIVRPSLDPRTRPQWPEAFYLLTYKTRLSYTLEAPSDFALEVRVRALVTAVRCALRRFLELSQLPASAGRSTPAPAR